MFSSLLQAGEHKFFHLIFMQPMGSDIFSPSIETRLNVSIQAMTPTYSASATTSVATTATVATTMSKFATMEAAAVPATVCAETVSDWNGVEV